MRNYFICMAMVFCAAINIHNYALSGEAYYGWAGLLCSGTAVIYGGRELRKNILYE